MSYQTILTPDQVLNRVQANVQNALNPTIPSVLSVVQTNPFNIPLTSKVIIVKTTDLPQSTSVSLILPDAKKLPGWQYLIKKTDTSSNSVVITCSAIGQAGALQTIDLATSYTLSASLDSVILISDGQNWWVIS